MLGLALVICTLALASVFVVTRDGEVETVQEQDGDLLADQHKSHGFKFERKTHKKIKPNKAWMDLSMLDDAEKKRNVLGDDILEGMQRRTTTDDEYLPHREYETESILSGMDHAMEEDKMARMERNEAPVEGALMQIDAPINDQARRLSNAASVHQRRADRYAKQVAALRAEIGLVHHESADIAHIVGGAATATGAEAHALNVQAGPRAHKQHKPVAKEQKKEAKQEVNAEVEAYAQQYAAKQNQPAVTLTEVQSKPSSFREAIASIASMPEGTDKGAAATQLVLALESNLIKKTKPHVSPLTGKQRKSLRMKADKAAKVNAGKEVTKMNREDLVHSARKAATKATKALAHKYVAAAHKKKAAAARSKGIVKHAAARAVERATTKAAAGRLSESARAKKRAKKKKKAIKKPIRSSRRQTPITTMS